LGRDAHLSIVRRRQINLEDEQDEGLSRRAQRTGVARSRLIRQAIDSLLDESTQKQSALTRFKSALNAIERAPIDVPDGAGYVEDLRSLDTQRHQELERRRR
jgi:predicted DNA-binding protein